MPQAVITIGIPASGKSTYAEALERQGFQNINLDDCRALVNGDPSDQTVTDLALKIHRQRLRDALAAGALIVISDTNLQIPFLTEKLTLFKDNGYHVTAAIFMTPLAVCEKRNQQRDRCVPQKVLCDMHAQLLRLLSGIEGLGFDDVQYFSGE
jgi:predicted kinase